MSFYDDASLVFLPSGQAGKDGKAYSMKPTNGDGDFTFSRGSNLAATRVGADGLIEKGRENLLKQSNAFSTSPWSSGLSGGTIVTGQTGYDGSSDAWLMTTQGTNGYLSQSISQSGVQTFSIYAKAGDAEYLLLRAYEDSTTFAYYHLTGAGSVTLTSGDIETKITRINGGDWYRCTLTYTGGLTLVRVYMAGNNTTAVNVGDNIYIQDAQLEIGLVPTEYIESGATKGKAGLLEQEPRFDYSGGASCASLLLEGSRTNEIGYSEYFEGWTPQGSPTITTNYGTSPEGLQNSSRLVFTSVSDYIETSVTNTSGVFTLYAKGTGNLILTDSGANASSTTALTSSYQRIELYFSTNTTTLQIKTDSSGLDAEVYAAQFENATYPTSYIPNHSGGSVTRDADVCEGAGTSSTFNAGEGVFYAEISTNTDDTDKAISLNNGVSGSLNNRLWMGYSTSNKRIYALGYVNNSLQFALSKLMTDESLFVKIACRYKRNDIAFFVNGVKVGTDTTALNFTELSSLDFNIGTAVSGASPFYGNVKEVLVFNSYLSDSEINTLTS